MAIDVSGNIYVSSPSQHAVSIYTASSGAVTATAGTPGTAGSGGDSGPATNAYLNGPQGVAVDSSANLYIADTKNCKVRLVATTTGIISTFAGTGTCGSGGDGGPAISTLLYGPTGIAVDSSDNVYFAVSPWKAPGGSFGGAVYYVAYGSGTVTRLAGVAGGQCCSAPGLSTVLNDPNGVAVDSSGNVYVVDNFYQSIRLLTRSTGIMTTFMGTGTQGSTADGAAAGPSSAVYSPVGMVADAFGNIFIADPGDPNPIWQVVNVIYRVTLSTGIVERYAGTGVMNTAGSSGDGGPARLAQLNSPQFLAVDASGDVYIADSGNGAIRKVIPQTTSTATPTAAPTMAPTYNRVISRLSALDAHPFFSFAPSPLLRRPGCHLHLRWHGDGVILWRRRCGQQWCAERSARLGRGLDG